jgi:deoxyribonuclease-4
VRGIADATKGLKSKTFEILIENTVGAGCSIGGKLQEVAAIRQLAERETSIRVNYCIDTCHCFCSGYDVSSETGLRDTVKIIDVLLGIDNVKVIHTNDSKTPFNSHVDRHENIGKGHIGLDGFRRILNHPKLKTKPFILETPVDEEGDDRRNLETLKSLVKKTRRG